MVTRADIQAVYAEARELENRHRAARGLGPIRSDAAAKRMIRARFDAAQTNDHNARHWAGADGLSADAAANPWVRTVLRNRSRYEVANNTYARGMLLTLANDTVGTGPRVRFLGMAKEAASELAADFRDWARAIGLPKKLRLARVCKAENGEAFLRLVGNPRVNHRVKLDVQLIEPDRVATPFEELASDPDAVDGIKFDRFGNPLEYHVLYRHPGTDKYIPVFDEFERVPADDVLHYFRADRAEQRRGVPELTPALPLFNCLRRYTLAVVGSAERAAAIAGTIHTQHPPVNEQSVEPFDPVDLNPGEWWTLPEGWQAAQFKSEQPTTTYGMFKGELINEIARCLNMPFNIAAGNSAGYNYSSGRLDHQVYYNSIWVERDGIETEILDRILEAWLDQATDADALPEGVELPAYGLPERRWYWDGFTHVDPAKEATAQTQRLANHTSTLEEECAREGLDWREVLEQRAEEARLMRELGLQTAAAPQASPAGPPQDDDQDQDNQPAAPGRGQTMPARRGVEVDA